MSFIKLTPVYTLGGYTDGQNKRGMHTKQYFIFSVRKLFYKEPWLICLHKSSTLQYKQNLRRMSFIYSLFIKKRKRMRVGANGKSKIQMQFCLTSLRRYRLFNRLSIPQLGSFLKDAVRKIQKVILLSEEHQRADLRGMGCLIHRRPNRLRASSVLCSKL